MKIISKETKEAIVKKILGKKDVNLKMIAKQNNRLSWNCRGS
jgi:hypothetical protein